MPGPRPAPFYRYTCECPNPWCDEKVRLRTDEYPRLAKQGRVVSAACADAQTFRKRAVAHRPGVVVISSSAAVLHLT